MLQVIQHQKSGEIIVEELPAPECLNEGILVRTEYSLISAGTERTSVTNAKSSLIQRAKRQPDQVKLVMDFIKKEGVMATAKRVLSTLASYKTMGYSIAGEVIESRCDEFAVGDLVACGGAGYAVHAEVITVPKNLAVKIPENVSLQDACYTTLGSIALQGIRQADLRLGENVAVIGLGLLGQLTVQMLKASGCRVVGMDINEGLFEKAKEYGCDVCYPSSKDYIKDVKAFTRGIGCDAVILTASTDSNEPVELALQLARKKGKVVVVGAVGMNIPRSPFYEKEIDLKISCSYGPGRYDRNYEELGHDYPAAYVRWTENRNMQAFLDLIASGNIDVESMTTHTMEIDKAAKAYDIITGKVQENFLGILLHYPERKDYLKRTVKIKEYEAKSEVKLAFLGAGSFAQNYLIPPLKQANVDFTAVSTATAVNAQTAAKKHGFAYSSTDSSELINHKDTNAVFCATLHDTHGKYVIESVEAGKPVFVEKPLAISREELEKISEAVEKHNGRVMTGFNRRFSKSFETIKSFFEGRSEPMNISYRVNAGQLPGTHWVYDKAQGSGRVIGEACHFIDCMAYLAKSLPVKVYAETISGKDPDVFRGDNIAITIKFADGSMGILNYLNTSDSSVPKELCEVSCGGSTAIMDNFTTVSLYKNGKVKKHTFDGKKGHDEEVLATIEAIKNGKEMPISFKELKAVTEATFAANESIKTGLPVML